MRLWSLLLNDAVREDVLDGILIRRCSQQAGLGLDKPQAFLMNAESLLDLLIGKWWQFIPSPSLLHIAVFIIRHEFASSHIKYGLAIFDDSERRQRDDSLGVWRVARRWLCDEWRDALSIVRRKVD